VLLVGGWVYADPCILTSPAINPRAGKGWQPDLLRKIKPQELEYPASNMRLYDTLRLTVNPDGVSFTVKVWEIEPSKGEKIEVAGMGSQITRFSVGADEIWNDTERKTALILVIGDMPKHERGKLYLCGL
jgi:hypothetical protein